MVVIFDGFCGLCNNSVDWLIQLDSENAFKYTPIQGQFVKSLHIPKLNTNNPDSILVWNNGIVYTKSEALFEITKKLPFPWKLLNMFSIIPYSFTNKIYDWIARNRYSWFGKSDSCRIPTPNERKSFLD
jgi:predicted DCC family thiol-disulfide oxidoreductase YuxK